MILVRDFWFRPIAHCDSVGELIERSGLSLDDVLDAMAGDGYVRGVWLEPEFGFVRWLESIQPDYTPQDPVGPKVIAEELGMSYSTVMRIVRHARTVLSRGLA